MLRARADNITRLTGLQSERAGVPSANHDRNGRRRVHQRERGCCASETTQQLSRVAHELGELVEQFRITRERFREKLEFGSYECVGAW